MRARAGVPGHHVRIEEGCTTARRRSETVTLPYNTVADPTVPYAVTGTDSVWMRDSQGQIHR